MIQKVIQIIYFPPVRITRTQRIRLPVRFIKLPGKAAEQLGHRQLRLRVVHIHRRVDQPCPAVASREKDSRPQVAVQQGRPFRFQQIIVEMLQKKCNPFLNIRTFYDLSLDLSLGK